MDYNGIIDAAYAVIMLIVGLVIKSIITKAVNDIRTWVETKFDSADKAQIEKNVINDNKINFILTEIKTNLLVRFNITNDEDEKENITITVDKINQLIGED